MSENLYANVNNIKICYSVYGKNNSEPLILVMGWGFKKERWRAQIGALSEFFKVITFDNRGVGKSDRPDMPYTMDIFTNDLIGLMDYLKIEKAHMIGYALGGFILQHLVLKYPNRVDKLILINTVPRFPDDSGSEMVKEGYMKGLKKYKDNPEVLFWANANLTFYPTFRKEMKNNPEKKFFGLWLVEDLIEELKIDPLRPQDVANQHNAMKGYNVLDRVSEIKHETLILAASHNRLHPKSGMEEMHLRMPNSTLKIIEKAGDFMILSRAPEINQHILEFLK